MDEIVMVYKKHKRSTHDFEELMYDLFPPEWLRETAREKGVVKRKRKIEIRWQSFGFSP